MPTVSQIIKLRNLRYTKEIHHPWMKVGLICGLVLSLLSVIIIIIGFWYYADLTRDLPSIDALPSLIEPPNGTMLQPTRLYDRTFTHVILTLEDPAAAGKQYLYVKADNPVGGKPLPQYLVDATLSASDPSFWKNPGFSFAGISKGTHPTLAQLLISNLILDTELPSIRRNIRERILAAQVTAHFGREKILEWYLNSAQYGENIYGVDAAARVYFGKSATKLSLAEAAMLVAIAETPSIEALTSPKTFMDQQHQTLQAMLTNGFISATDAQKALNENIQFVTHPETQLLAPAFTDLVLMQLSTALPLGRIRHGGYEIITTLDYELQSQADCASKVQLSRIQRTEERPVTFDSTPCDAARLLPTLQSGDEKPRQDLNVNVVILDPHSGQIMALVGDNTSGMDPAYPSVHSAGTILSPFLYLTAFTRGMSPATLLWDIPSASGTNGLGSTQRNVTQGISLSYHGPVRLRMAFVNDYAGAATEVLQQVGADNVWLTERRFGITPTEVEPISGASLDDLYSQQIDLLESVQAYAILANQGIMTGQPGITNPLGNNLDGLYPTSILRVMGVDGQVWLDWSTAQSRSIVSSQLAYLTTNVLSDENARWLSLGHPNALEIGRPAAAKIGLTINGNGAWTVGYIPQLAIGVWVGHSQNESGGISAEIPAGLWHAMMQYGSNQEPVEDFNMPTGITRVQVCDPSGLLVPFFAQQLCKRCF
jgi:membrane peptidoglycan carboxypeptidase